MTRNLCLIVTALTLSNVYAGGDESCAQLALSATVSDLKLPPSERRDFPLILPGNLRLYLNDTPVFVLHDGDLVIIRTEEGFSVSHRVREGFEANGEMLKMSTILPYMFEHPQHLVESADVLTRNEKNAIKANKLAFDLGCSDYRYKSSYANGVVYALGRGNDHYAFVVDDGERIHQVDFKGRQERFLTLLGSLSVGGE